MSITPGTNYQTELDRESGARPCYLMSLNFTTGFRRFALGPYDVSFGGSTFFGFGPLMTMDTVEVGAMLGEHFLTFAVQNDPDLLADLMQNSRNRFYTLRLVFLDTDGTVIDSEAITLAHRRMVPSQLTGGRGQYLAAIGTESRFHEHQNRAPRTYSDAEQKQSRDATDFAFQDMGKQLDTSRPSYRRKSGLS